MISPKAPSERGLREAVEEIAQRAVQISLPTNHQIFLCTHSPSVACATAPSRKEPFGFFAPYRKNRRRKCGDNRYFGMGNPSPTAFSYFSIVGEAFRLPFFDLHHSSVNIQTCDLCQFYIFHLFPVCSEQSLGIDLRVVEDLCLCQGIL